MRTLQAAPVPMGCTPGSFTGRWRDLAGENQMSEEAQELPEAVEGDMVRRPTGLWLRGLLVGRRVLLVPSALVGANVVPGAVS